MKTWIDHYKTNKNAIWIKCKLTNGEELFFDNFNDWIKIKDRLSKENLFFESLSLQFRSHEYKLDVDNCDGIYLVRSVMGQIGSSVKNYYTFGRIEGGKVHKQMLLVPELIVERNETDLISDCFPEAIIYNEKKKN